MAFLLEHLTRPDVEAYLRTDDRLILVIGSTEQHGRHLPLSSDVLVPRELANRLSDRTGVLVAPALPYGMSLHHLDFPGTLSLRPTTLAAVVTDILRSAYGHGFRHILILNGHGGNIAALQVALAEVLDELADLTVHLGSWWREPACDAILDAAFPEPGGHADAGETSVVMAVRPDLLRLDQAAFSPGAPEPSFLTRRSFREHYPHGVIGPDPRRASAEIGRQALAAAAQHYIAILDSWKAVG